MAPETDRRTAIADAAIAIVAEHGIRALTHRAVDRHLHLPTGSTSYYLRTRQALLTAVVGRLADRTTEDLRGLTGTGGGGAGPGAGGPELATSLDALAGGAGVVLDRMIGDRRGDSLARYALTLELARDPELHRLLAAGQPFREAAQAALTLLGAPDPAGHAADLVSCTDGLVYDRLVGARSLTGPAAGSQESIAELTRAVRTQLRGIFGV